MPRSARLLAILALCAAAAPSLGARRIQGPISGRVETSDGAALGDVVVHLRCLGHAIHGAWPSDEETRRVATGRRFRFAWAWGGMSPVGCTVSAHHPLYLGVSVPVGDRFASDLGTLRLVAWDEVLAAGPRDPPLHPAYPWPVMEIQQHLFGTLHDFVREHPERRRAALARYVPALHSIFESALRRLPATWHSDSSWNDSLREHLRRIESATHFERPAAQHELAEAAGAGDTARLRELLAAGVDPDAYGADGAAAIHRAAAAGHAESIAALLDGGAAIDRQREGLGSSALFDAVANHRDEAALLLIERGADVNLAAWRGTPLQAAAQGNVRPEVLRALAAHGALARAPERPDVVRALQAASRNGYTGIVRAVLDAGVPADARLGRPGWTALMAACASGEDETAALLLEAGADPNAASEDGRTPLSLAREHERTALEALLLRAGARE